MPIIRQSNLIPETAHLAVLAGIAENARRQQQMDFSWATQKDQQAFTKGMQEDLQAFEAEQAVATHQRAIEMQKLITNMQWQRDTRLAQLEMNRYVQQAEVQQQLALQNFAMENQRWFERNQYLTDMQMQQDWQTVQVREIEMAGKLQAIKQSDLLSPEEKERAVLTLQTGMQFQAPQPTPSWQDEFISALPSDLKALGMLAKAFPEKYEPVLWDAYNSRMLEQTDQGQAIKSIATQLDRIGKTDLSTKLRRGIIGLDHREVTKALEQPQEPWKLSPEDQKAILDWEARKAQATAGVGKPSYDDIKQQKQNLYKANYLIKNRLFEKFYITPDNVVYRKEANVDPYGRFNPLPQYMRAPLQADAYGTQEYTELLNQIDTIYSQALEIATTELGTMATKEQIIERANQIVSSGV